MQDYCERYIDAAVEPAPRRPKLFQMFALTAHTISLMLSCVGLFAIVLTGSHLLRFTVCSVRTCLVLRQIDAIRRLRTSSPRHFKPDILTVSSFGSQELLLSSFYLHLKDLCIISILFS